MRYVLTMLVVGALAFVVSKVPPPEVNPGLASAKFVSSPDVQAIKDAKVRDIIVADLEAAFGSPNVPKFPADLDLKLPALGPGAAFYREKCMHCHGLSGDGAGPTAPFLNPPPRDFRRGTFKFTSTDASTKKPTDDDLRRLLKNGATHTAMPSFALDLMDAPESVDAVIQYVKYLSIRGETEGMLVVDAENEEVEAGKSIAADLKNTVKRWTEAPSKVKKINPASEATPERIENGRKLFNSDVAKCSSCHGAEGRGNGPSAIDPRTGNRLLLDDWKNPILPANLTRGVYRGGWRPLDLYRRIAFGIKGTPMPGFESSLTPEQIWDIVHYVRQIPYAGKGGASR